MPLISKINSGKVFLKDYFSINKALIWALVFKAWLLLKGPASLFFLIYFLSPAEQGYWYVFINLSALMLFAELGFNTITTQFVSHEYALLKLEDGVITGPRYNIDRLFELIKYAVRFYLIVLPVAIIVMWIFGVFVLGKEKQIGLILAWFVYAFLGAANLLLSLIQYIYQGLDKVEDIQKNILAGSVTMALSSWILLVLGFKIWSLIIGNLIGLIVMSFFLLKKTKRFWLQFFQHKVSYKSDWFKEISGLQGRYAVSWISAFFMSSFITPIVMYFSGPVAAGKVGMTLSITSSLINIPGSWGMVRIPQFNILVSQKNKELLDKLFKKIQKQSTVVYLAGIFFLAIFLIFIFPVLGWDKRILPLSNFGVLLLAGFASLSTANMAFYLRAHKEEPYMWLSVANGVITSILVISALYFFSSVSIAINGYALTQVIIFYFAYLIFKKKKERTYGINKTSGILL